MEEALYYFAIAALVAMIWMMLTVRGAMVERRPMGLLHAAGIVLAAGALFYAWRGDLGLAALFSLVYGLEVLVLGRPLADWNTRGRAFIAALATAQLIFLARVAEAILFEQLAPPVVLASLVLLAAELLVVALTLYYAYEVLDVMCRTRWRRAPKPHGEGLEYLPKVSVHVPAHAEPPEMVIETLRALRSLDYPNYEVIMIDDNTEDDQLWRPVVEFCHQAGFKVYHLQNYPGFKSGALNFALAQAAADTEIIAVVDSDYRVRPDFLKDTVPYFRNPRLAFVQTPQAFSNADDNLFARRSALAQRFFFEISMRSRNERNAIIFCGTMGLIRRRALERIGGWDEWCITEDAEASLRLLRKGYEGLYVNQAYGHGVLPTTFADTKKQRFRWAFGGMQILKRYWRELIPWPRRAAQSGLTVKQKLVYLLGLLGWVNDLLVLVFTGFLLMTALAFARGWTLPIRQLAEWILLVPVVSIVTGTLRVAWALRATTRCSWSDGVGAFGAMLAFSWTVARACLSALYHDKGTFLRTPKFAVETDLSRALRAATGEAILGVVLLAAIPIVLNVRTNWEGVLLALLLGWHALVYLSALRSALIEIVPVGADQALRHGSTIG